MSIRQLNAVLEYLPTAPKDITTPYRLLLLLLEDRANDDLGGVSWPSHAWLAEHLGLSDRYVRHLLTDLEKKGLILVVDRSREGKSNKYSVTLGVGTIVPGGVGSPVPRGRNQLVPGGSELASSYEPLKNHLITNRPDDFSVVMQKMEKLRQEEEHKLSTKGA
jgi:DNA-binding transcriptional ArsR family regulator